MLVNPGETVAVTTAVTTPVLPGSTTLGAVYGCIEKKQVCNQQVRMMPAKFFYL